MTDAAALLRGEILPSRHDRLRAAAESGGADVVITASFENFAYVTGAWISTFPWLPGRRVYGVVDSEGLLPVVSSLQVAELEETGVADLVEFPSDSGDPEEALLAALQGRYASGTRFGLDADGMPASVLTVLTAGLERIGTVVSASSVLDRCRRIKDRHEQEELRAIGAVASEASRSAVEQTREGESERDLGRRISEYTIDRGAGEGFIVLGSGRRSTLTHPSPTPKPLRYGEAVRIDVIRRSASGYVGDIARTVVVGEPSPAQARCYEVANAGLRAAIDALTPGEPLCRAYEACEALVSAQGEQLAIGHVGHGIGLELHESPVIGPHTQDLCEVDMVLCLEAIVTNDHKEWFHVEQLVKVEETGAALLAGALDEYSAIRGSRA